MQSIDKCQLYHAVKAASSRKLLSYMMSDWGRRDLVEFHFDRIVNFCRVLASTDKWMTLPEILESWPEGCEMPHDMHTDDLVRVIAYSGAARTDRKLGWSKYRWPPFTPELLAAVADFRFTESYSSYVPCIGGFRSVALSDLFCPFPQSWGLRGDSFLWGKLASHLSWEIAANANIEEYVKDGFRHITGEDFDRVRDNLHSAGFAHGGMSSGHVSMEWWRQTGLRILTSRFDVIKPALPVYFIQPEADGLSAAAN